MKKEGEEGSKEFNGEGGGINKLNKYRRRVRRMIQLNLDVNSPGQYSHVQIYL